MSRPPNVLFIVSDMLRACALPPYGENQVTMPNISRLASEGVVFSNAISTCAMCSPYRSMLLTGRHPQTTGHLNNFVRIRHDEISIGDTFNHAGYRTGWIGKWHLHSGSFPCVDMSQEGVYYIPEGRDRLGFQFWRAYNFHINFTNGWVNKDNWENERWEGYETDALARYAAEFLNGVGDEPFCLFVSPHQPHYTLKEAYAPEKYYTRLPNRILIRRNVPESIMKRTIEEYRHYLAMILAVDDMVGKLLDHLDRTGKMENTIVVFTADHGATMGSHGYVGWGMNLPYQEVANVPFIIRWPGGLENGRRRDVLISPVDIFPSLCGLCGIPAPRTIEGTNLSAALQGQEKAFEQDAVLMMKLNAQGCTFLDETARLGMDPRQLEWRGVRTKRYCYAQWIDGRKELYDLETDLFQMSNLAGKPEAGDIQGRLEEKLRQLMAKRKDELLPGYEYRCWFDNYRRVVRNTFGALGHPEEPPDLVTALGKSVLR